MLAYELRNTPSLARTYAMTVDNHKSTYRLRLKSISSVDDGGTYCQIVQLRVKLR